MGETSPCIFHRSKLLRACVRTCRLISFVGVKWPCLQIDKQAFPPVFRQVDLNLPLQVHALGFPGPALFVGSEEFSGYKRLREATLRSSTHLETSVYP